MADANQSKPTLTMPKAEKPAPAPEAPKVVTTVTAAPPKSALPETVKLSPKTLAEQEAGRTVLEQYQHRK